jgi:hypothetical protein
MNLKLDSQATSLTKTSENGVVLRIYIEHTNSTNYSETSITVILSSQQRTKAEGIYEHMETRFTRSHTQTQA